MPYQLWWRFFSWNCPRWVLSWAYGQIYWNYWGRLLTSIVPAHICVSFRAQLGLLALNNALYLLSWGAGKLEALDGQKYLKVGQTKEALVCPSTWRKSASFRDGLKINENECVFAGWESIAHTVVDWFLRLVKVQELMPLWLPCWL